MGKVIQLPARAPRAAAGSETAVVLGRMSEQEKTGELQGSILISTTSRGTEFHVLGTCAERLQLAVLAMVKGLNIITDKIVATGAAGNSKSDPVSASWEAPRRKQMPRRLREVTELGDLE